MAKTLEPDIRLVQDAHWMARHLEPLFVAIERDR